MTANETGRRVLLVDDSLEVTDALGQMIGMLGHRVRCAHDGPSALAAAADHRPDLVIVDLGLPGMSGDELCEQLRTSPGGQALVIVALTGWDRDDVHARSRFDRHVTKPIGLIGLREVLALHPPRDP